MGRQELATPLGMAFCAWFYASLMIVSSGKSWSSSINGIFSSRSFEPGKQITESAAAGAQLALTHCQQLFQWDQWNCPETAFSRQGRQSPNRETALVLALTAAGVAFSVTQNCSRGEISGCGCDPRRSGKAAVSFQVMDELEEGLDMQAYVNRHNMAAGREALRKTMQKKCRCHGVSGSCSSMTCWMQMASFREVTSRLRQRYERAVRIGFEKGRGVRALGNAVMSNSAKEIPLSVSSEQLLYITDSPDYCLPDPESGWAGTHGRLCSRASAASNASLAERRSCRVLCRACGHRVQRQQREHVWRCNCTFRWCCDVTCQTCRKIITDHYCA
ncbi:Protein Wnt-1 [Gryllus bimaculatus]|nr:Protein Wnt-1 [Gryllus bimaculatus]